ncbi:MAG: hypothetical protein ACR2MO_12795 [Acidimicrobiales bacterium]
MRVLTAHPVAPPGEDSPPAEGRRRALRLAVALPVAALFSVLLRGSLSNRLDVRTDVVGYPIYRDFNVFGNFRTFEIAALVFPLLALALYVALGFVLHVPHQGWGPQRRRPPVLTSDVPHIERDGRGALGRLLFAGAVMGMEVAFIRRTPGGFWLVVVVFAIAYAAAVVVAAAQGWQRLPGVTQIARRSALNALIIPTTILLLYAVSDTTRVTVVADSTVHHQPWLPLWLAAIGTAVVVGLVVRAVARAGSDDDLRRLERQVVLLLAGSVGLFLLLARLPTAVGSIDFFHDGESLAAADLVGRGDFPWRDIIFLHGVLEDIVKGGLGMWVFGNDVWGGIAGQTVLLAPLYWVGLYLLYVYLFGRNWLFLVLTTTLLVQGWLTPNLNRMLLFPFLLLALAALLRRATPARAVLFVAVGLISVLLTPETALAVVAAGITLVAFEAWYRQPGAPLVRTFHRTLWCMAAGLVGSVIWCAYLALNGALGSFIYTSRSFVSDHELTGGIPLTGDGFDFWFAIVVPVSVAVLMLWYFGARLAGRRPVAVADWVMAAVALFVLMYFRKFLSRADAHAFHVLAMSLPLLYYAVHLLVDAAESALRRQPWGERMARVSTSHPVTLALIVVVLATTPGPPLSAVQTVLPHRLDIDVAEENPGLGYSDATAVDRTMISDVQAVLDAVLSPGDQLFDMSNSPALFHYILRTEPATRYYHISMAIREPTQADLIAELRESKPKVVVLDGGYGLTNWDDIPNVVRHYDIAQYVLRGYRPLVWVRSHLLLLRDDVEAPSLATVGQEVTQPIATERLYEDFRPCDWGYTPEFLEGQPSEKARRNAVSLAFTATAAGRGHDVAIAVPPGMRLAQFSRLEIETKEPLKDDTFSLSQPPAGSRFPISFKTLADGDNRTSIQVGSCPQWYAYAGGSSLTLHSDRGEEITAVRLYP